MTPALGPTRAIASNCAIEWQELDSDLARNSEAGIIISCFEQAFSRGCSDARLSESRMHGISDSLTEIFIFISLSLLDA